ncbi:MAG: DUF1232 domain-containing protein [Bacteroidales bacterium]|nr:DUF1232 domain-containing protein [Bacteroidales bacterium]MBP5721835.1 DUF1232 domain-containing protein [Bacteroidales bacterium]
MKPKNIEKYQDRYNEQDFIAKVTKAAKKAGIKVVYLALILYYVLKSPKVKMADKGKIWGALGYFILPIDLIPDFVPIAGYTDDLAALLWAFYSVAKNVTPEIESQAKRKLHEWFGDYDEKEIIIEKNPDNDPDVDIQD